jgi:hypothetical protein
MTFVVRLRARAGVDAIKALRREIRAAELRFALPLG